MNINYLERDGKPTLAYIYTPAAQEGKPRPLVMFLGGYRSDMNGTKATYFEQRCIARGQAFLRFDYSGHGKSDGKFEDGTIGAWAADVTDVLNHAQGDQKAILVGSSMGGWIALLAARANAHDIHALIGIAAAPDFTEEIYHQRLDAAQRKTLMETGIVTVENDYSDEPYSFTRDFYEDGKSNLVLSQSQNLSFPLHLFQGMQDKDVPPETATKIAEIYGLNSSAITFIKDGDHRLSRPQDLERIDQAIESMSA